MHVSGVFVVQGRGLIPPRPKAWHIHGHFRVKWSASCSRLAESGGRKPRYANSSCACVSDPSHKTAITYL